VLLCAEEDDLELVSWVHNARKHGITPEVVIGVERDDEPLIEALADADARLFVVLRSENLDLKRIHELKSVFARHRRHGQELLALRLQPEEAEDAIVKIAARIGRDLRPRTGSFAAVGFSERSGVTPLSERSGITGLSERSGVMVLSERSGVTPLERSGATPLPVLNDATPVDSGTDPTGGFSIVDVAKASPAVAPEAPPVAEALAWARRATELEVTESLPRVDPTPLFAAASERASDGRARPVGLAALATITAVVMLGAVVGGVLWMSASEWTSPSDGVPRSTVVAPVGGEPAADGDAPSEARIPTMPRRAEEPTTKRSRSKPRAQESSREHAEPGPFDTIEPATPSTPPPSESPPSSVADTPPAVPTPGSAPPETASASASTSAAAEPRPTPVAATETTAAAPEGDASRPPA